MDPLREIVLPKLDGIRKAGAGFAARCPAHDDKKASLMVGPGHDQPVVFHCHAGCPPDAVVDALGVTWADLSAPRSNASTVDEWTPAGPAVAVYDYRDEQGNLLFQVLRTAGKEFRQRVPDRTAKSGWTWKLGDTRRVMYRLPEVIQAIKDGRRIWIVEGEKDVHSLETINEVATCNPGGAGKWLPAMSEVLREATVTVVADRDAPGQAHARMVATSLDGIADEVRIVEPIAGKDTTDHLAAGHGVGDFVETWSSTAPWADDRSDPDVWEFLRTGDPAYDWIVPHLIERGDRLMLTGYEGLGKSMLSRQFAVMVAAGLHPWTYEEIPPHKVLLIDCENSERQSRRKFAELAPLSIQYKRRVPDRGLILIHRPAGIDLTGAEDAAWLRERAWAHRPDMLVIGPFYRLHMGDMNEEAPARRVVGVLDSIRARFGCALVIEAHSGHGDGSRNRSVRPVGSSLLLRWPEFGYGLSNVTDDGSVCDLRPWRGPRDERDFPKRLTWGGRGRWPWVPSSLEPV
jgi:5S rRNA maturation endonuclease (ribonuclease M5)